MAAIATLASDRLHYIGRSIALDAPVSIDEGVTAVCGPNGAGKSTLGEVFERGQRLMTNRVLTPDGQKLRARMIEFNDIHTLTDGHAAYRQQRYESTMNDDVPTVGRILGPMAATPQWQATASRLGIEGLAERRINGLSSGELRKLLIARALVADRPRLLILDNPYIGLDAPSRKVVDSLLSRLPAEGVAVMLLVADPADIPDFTDALLLMDGMRIIASHRCGAGGAAALRARAAGLFSYAVDTASIPRPAARHEWAGEEVFSLDGCQVAYGGHVIVPRVDWRVRRGECWGLFGPNGSGKSTLLSLIHADNPQAYSNPVSVFGRRRGTGESIWDVKRMIGYVSPEEHLYFHGGAMEALEVIARGLNDTVGSYTRLRPQQLHAAERWVTLLHLEPIAHRPWRELSAGQQRMVLLARTLIKGAPLLILDEPLHGLDAARKRAVKAVVNTLAVRDGVTLIYVTHRLEELPECITHTFTLPAPDAPRPL